MVVWDTDSDPLVDVLFPGGSKPADIIPKDECFNFPEASDKGENETVFRVSVNVKDFYDAMRKAFPLSDEEYEKANELALPIGRLQSIFVYMLFGRVITDMHPGHSLPVTLRCPVNLRSICHKENALHNFSLPQAVFKISLDAFERGLNRDSAKELVQQLERQLSPENLVFQLNALKDWAETKNLEQGMLLPAVSTLFRQSMIVTNVGKEYYEPRAGRVLADLRYAAGGYPFAVYLNRVGESQIITVSQSFESDRYYREFVLQMERYGIRRSENAVF
jgi:hypothetical protein